MVAVMMMAASVLMFSANARADDPIIQREALVAPDRVPGVGYGLFEGAHLLQLTLTGAGDWVITQSECDDRDGLILWYPVPEGSNETTAKSHLWEAAGILPDFTEDYPDIKSHAAWFWGYLAKGGSGGSGPPPEFSAAVSDVDQDCDSLNLVELLRRPPALSPEEDEAEFPEDGAVGTTPPPGMMVSRFEGPADLKVRVNAKRPSWLSIQVSSDYASKFIIGRWDGATFTELEELANPNVTPEPGYVALDEQDADGTVSWTYGVRPKTWTANPAEDEEPSAISAVIVSNTSGEESYGEEPEPAIDRVKVQRIREDVDTNRDDLVELGDDLLAFGPDSGTIAWQVERDKPQVYIPLAAAQWNQLTVHAYIAQGAFQYVKNTYWQHPDADEEGLWQAYSLHTRAKLIYLYIDPEDDSKNVKRVSVVRPRGNVVSFQFPWNEDQQKFEPYGLPLGVNNKRTYILRDTTPNDDNDLAYHLYFDSGVIHEFGGEEGLIQAVSHVDGRRVEVASMAGVSLDPLANSQTSPRYDVTLTWQDGRIIRVEYEDPESDAEVTVDLTYDQAGEGLIEVLDKTIGEFSASVSGTTITYGEGGGQWTIQRAQQAGVVTLTTTLPDSKTITSQATLNDNTLVTRRTISASGVSGTSATDYTYLADGDFDTNGSPITGNRYENNQAAMWAKVTRVDYPLGRWEKREYWNEDPFKTGWLKRRLTPFKGSSAGDPDNSHVVAAYDYDSADAGGGDAASNTYLAERPREVVTQTLGVETARTYHRHSGDETIIRQARVKGAAWGHGDNLETTVTRHIYGPSDVVGPTGGATYAAAAPTTKMTVTATHKGPGGASIATTTTRVNAFGYVESTQTVDSGVIVSQASSSLHDDGFGRLDRTDYLGGLYSQNVSYSIWGPTEARATDGSKTTYQYDVIGRLSQDKHYPDGDTGSGRNIETAYTRDALGNVTATETVARKPGQDNITLTTAAVYDVFGRLTSSTNAEGKTTTTSHGSPSGGVIIATTTFPDGTTKAIHGYIEGRTKEISGTAVYPENYDYGVDGTDGMWSTVSRNSGNDWSRTYLNLVGQGWKTVRSAPGGSATATTTFDSKARPVRHDGFDETVALTTYDGTRGYVDASILDVDKSGGYSAGDRRTSYDYQVASGKHQTTATIHCSTGDSTLRSEVATSGLETWATVNSKTTHSQTTLPGGGDSTATTTYPDGTKSVATVVDGALTGVQDQTTGGGALVSTSFATDALARVNQFTDRRGTTYFNTINKLGQVNKTTLPDSREFEVTARNNMMQPTTFSRLDGRSQSATYGNKGEFTGASGAGIYQNEQAASDSRGLYTGLTTHGGSGSATTNWSYQSSVGLPSQKSIAGDTVATFAYNTKFQMTSLTQPGATATYSYNAGTGDPTGVSLTGGINYGFTYDDKGRVTGVSGPLGSKTLTYNVDDQVTSETLPHTNGLKLEYAFDGQGRPTGVTLKNAANSTLLSYTYGYDGSTGRSSGVTAGAQSFSWTYQSNSHLLKDVSFPGGMTLTRTFEADNDRLASVATAVGGTTLYAGDFQYNDVDQKTQVDVTRYRPGLGEADSFSWHYAYDADSAIAAGGSVTGVDNGGNVLNFSETWTGDNNDPWPARWSWEDSSAQAGPSRSAVIDDNRGKVTLTMDAKETESVAWMNGDTELGRDVDMTATFRLTADDDQFGLVARGRYDGDSFGGGFDDIALVVYVKAGSNRVHLRKDITGLGRDVDDSATMASSIAVDTDYRMRLKVAHNGNGTTDIKFKVWAASGQEPGTWTVDTTDSALHSGKQIGFGRFGLFFGARANDPGDPSDPTSRVMYVDDLAVQVTDALTGDDWARADSTDWLDCWSFEKSSGYSDLALTATTEGLMGKLVIAATSAPGSAQLAEVVAHLNTVATRNVDQRILFKLPDLNDRFGMVVRGSFDGDDFGDGRDDVYIHADVGGDANSPVIRIRKENSDGSGSDLATDSVTLSANTQYYMRVAITDEGSDNVKIKVWALDAAEPANWTLTATESTLTAIGSVGLYFGCQVSDTSDHIVYVDNYSADAAPAAPSGLVATAVSHSRIDLAWLDTSRRESGFKIERSDNGTSGWTQIGTVGSGVTVYSDNGRSSSTAYYYRVRAHNDQGDSAYSSVASATTSWTPSALATPRDHLAMAVAKHSDGRVIPGEFFAYDYDGIGNREHEVTGSGTPDAYNNDIRNQVDSRGVAGEVRLAGFTDAGNTVELVYGGVTYPAHRDGGRWYGVVPVDNSSGPVAATVTVNIRDGSGTLLSSETVTKLVPRATDTWTYDGRGNKTDDSVYAYTWDAQDRLAAVQVVDAIKNDGSVPSSAKVRVEFTYDAEGRRATKTVKYWIGDAWSTQYTVKFVWAGWRMLAELNGDDELVRSYVWGHGPGGVGGLLEVRHHDLSDGSVTARYQPVYDDNGNVLAYIDAEDENHAVVAAFDYTPYGQVRAVDGAGATLANPAYISPLLFSTKYFDHEIGLYYYGYRYLEPGAGRWLNRDPLAEQGGVNLYGFCANDPINLNDPLGLVWRSEVWYRHDEARKALDRLNVAIQSAKNLSASSATEAQIQAAREGVQQAYDSYNWWNAEATRYLGMYLKEVWWVGPYDAKVSAAVNALPIVPAGVTPTFAQLDAMRAACAEASAGAAEAVVATDKTYNRVAGVGKTAGAAGQAVLGTACALAPEPTMGTKVAAGVLYYRAADNGWAGLKMIWTGESHNTYTHAAIRTVAESAGANPGTAYQVASWSEVGIDVAANVGGGIAYAHSCQLAANNPNLVGQQGMSQSGITQNTRHIDSLTGTAKYRVPDGLDRAARTLTEVKNTANLSYTNQLRDMNLFAQQNGYTFQLFTRANTTFSAPLQAEIAAGNIVLNPALTGPATFPMWAVPATVVPKAPDIVETVVRDK